MKKMGHTLMAIGIVILAASFFAACGDSPEEDGPSAPGGPTYTLVMREGSGNAATPFVNNNVDMVQGTQKTISRAVLEDGATMPTTGITWACNLTSETSGVSLNNSWTVITAAATATAGTHSFTATASKDGAIFATTNFTVTVTAAAYGIAFTYSNVQINHQNGSSNLNYTISAPGGNTAGLTLAFACTTHPGNCGIAFSGPNQQGFYQINEVPNTVALGAHSITATLNGTGLPTAPTATFTVTVLPKYFLSVTESTYSATRGQPFDFSDKFSLTISTGDSLVIGSDEDDDPNSTKIKVAFGCLTHYDNCHFFEDPEAEWRDLVVDVSDTAEATHNMALRAYYRGGWGGDIQNAVASFVVNVGD